MKRTVAHWGSYLATDGPKGLVLRPDPDDPKPSLVGRGWLSGAQDPDVRIHQPAIRAGWLGGDGGANRNSDSFIEVSWDRATKLVAAELGRVIDAHGNGAIYAGSYGWASAGRFHHAQSQMRRFLNLLGGFCAKRDTYSHAAGAVLLPYIIGMSQTEYMYNMTSWPLVADHCELLLAFGGISGRTAQITSSGTSVHDVEHWLKVAADSGTRKINISPQKDDGDDMPGSEWLPLRPGTDTALMLALAYEIHQRGGHDETFLARYTSGWPVFRDYLTGKTDGVAKSADWAGPICDINADVIRALAQRMIGKHVLITVNWGIQRAHHGEQPVWMGMTLAAMLGGIGQPGAGFGFGYGSTTPIGRPTRIIAWPSLPQGKNPVSDFIPVARLSDMLLKPSQTYRYDGQERTYPDIRLVYWVGGNPFHHHQDLFRLEQAWTQPETVIVHDHSWTATARRADIVLPSTSSLERNDIMMNPRDPALIYMSKLTDPIGASLSDHEIFRRIAAHFDLETTFTEGRDEEDWLRWLWSKSAQIAEANGFSLPDFETFRAKGRFDVPESFETRVQKQAFIADPEASPLKTESGKITLFNAQIDQMKLDNCPGHPCWMPPVEWLGDADEDELHLISGQPATRLHSQLDSGHVAAGGKIAGREPCVLHPDTAKRHSISAGDLVLISNRRGACLAGARLSSGIRADCIALATGAWFDPQDVDGQRIEVHGNPNVLTIDLGSSDLTQGNISHTALVRIARWTKAAPEIIVHRQPALEDEPQQKPKR